MVPPGREPPWERGDDIGYGWWWWSTFGENPRPRSGTVPGLYSLPWVWAYSRSQKKAAVSAERYDEAQRLKVQEVELEHRMDDLRPVGGGSRAHIPFSN